MKTCSRCAKEKSLDDFHIRKRSRDGRQPYCKRCAIETATIWQANNRAGRPARARRYRYGIAESEFKRLVEEQEGVCAICKTSTELHVDHDHDTGLVRGLLCGGCNRGIGLLKDSPTWLRRAAAYVER